MKKWTLPAAVAALLIAVVLGLGYLFLSKRPPTLTVVTWAESYGHAQITGQMLPFARASRADVIFRQYDGGTKELAREVATKQYTWDVFDLEGPDAIKACDQGLLEPIDASSLPASPKGTPAAEDFVPGAIGPCWVASVVYSQVIAFRPHRFGDAEPASLSDFFDTKRFPGPRAMNKSSAKLNLEMALLADGVAAKNIYAVLSTPEGVRRALAKLDTIKADIVWWTGFSEPAQMLADGRAVLASMPNWAVFDADMKAAGPKLAIVWDRQLYQVEALGIPKGDPKRALAMDYIRFATQAPQLARMSSWAAYGPARRSALPLVQHHPEFKVAMTPYLPTAHFENAFAVSDRWWIEHGAGVEPLWQSWVARGP